MDGKPCPCCGHDDVAVNLAIKDILEQNETLRAERSAHAAEVERLTQNNAQLVKTLDIREAALRDLLDAMRSSDPIQAANCRVLEYHQLKEEVANLKAERDKSKPDKDDGIVVWDLDKMMWEIIKKAASESNWIPEEYFMNDWVSDVCGWLRDHPEDKVERLTGETYAIKCDRDGYMAALEKIAAERDLLRAEADRLERDFNTASLSAERTAADRDAAVAAKELAESKLAAAVEALRAYIDAYTPDGHVAPYDCFSTGPLTGDIVSDLLACPGCVAKKKSDAIIAGHAPATPMLDQLEAPPQPITVQAAPGDRERRLVKDAFFDGFCAGESSTIGEPEKYWDKSEARAALVAVPDKPQYSALSPEPWGGPEGEE